MFCKRASTQAGCRPSWQHEQTIEEFTDIEENERSLEYAVERLLALVRVTSPRTITAPIAAAM